MAFERESQTQLPSDTLLWDILESVTDAVVTIDEDHKVLVCNKAAEDLFGYKSSEIVGKDVSPLIPDPHQSIHRAYVERYLNTGIPRVIGKARECFAQHRDGRTFPVEISYSVSRTGGRLYFTAVIRDISLRKEMEREIRFMERFADVGKAVAHISHEIRKPLTLIGGFARQVERCGALQEDINSRHKLDIIVDEVARLETLLNGLRLLTRPPASSRKRPLELNTLMRETLELLDPMLQDRQIELAIDLGKDPLPIQGDPDQLKQVFLNLLQNAMDAIHGNGKIHLNSAANSGKAHLVIEDSGPGIPAELREKVFDPFFTTKAEGTGLGLAISKNIIQDHGGLISLHTSIHGGAAFVIQLPLEPSA